MKTSEQIDKLLPDLFKVKKAITPLKKEANNPFFNSAYADLNTVLNGVEPLLEANNFVLLQPVTGRVVETILLHTSGQFISSDMELVLAKNDMQAMGSAVSYARRYSLMSLLGLKSVDDDGESSVGRATVVTKTSQRSPKPAEAVAKAAQLVDTSSPSPAPASTVSTNSVSVPAARKPFNRPAAPAATQPVSNGAASAAEFD